jgi:hypothetical protein
MRVESHTTPLVASCHVTAISALRGLICTLTRSSPVAGMKQKVVATRKFVSESCVRCTLCGRYRDCLNELKEYGFLLGLYYFVLSGLAALLECIFIHIYNLSQEFGQLILF